MLGSLWGMVPSSPTHPPRQRAIARPTAWAIRSNGPGPPRTGGGIAVIDVTYILEHYSRLKQAMEVYKRDAQGAEDALKKERDGIAKRAERLKTLKPGSPDFKAEEEAITKAEQDGADENELAETIMAAANG